jgi:hypothetical protein
MNISLNNLKKPSNPLFKKIADYLLYTLPLVSTAIVAVPLPESAKLWIIFGLNIVVIGFKGLSKLSAEDTSDIIQVPNPTKYIYPYS